MSLDFFSFYENIYNLPRLPKIYNPVPEEEEGSIEEELKQEEMYKYESPYLAPYNLEDRSIKITSDVNSSAIRATVLVHDLDSYKKLDSGFLLMPRISTLLDLILEGVNQDEVIPFTGLNKR